MKNLVTISIIFMVSILSFMTGCHSKSSMDEMVPEVKAIYTSQPLKLDGKLSDPAWLRAEWVSLDRSRPEYPKTQEEWKQVYNIAGTRKPVIDQFAQKVKAAVIWSDAGLYFGLKVEDLDVQGKINRDNDWLWLEDVVEVFLAGNRKEFRELQVNPSNAIFWDNKGNAAYRPKTAVYVDGSVNNSKELDKFWSVEIFLPWSLLEKSGLAIKPGKTKSPVCCGYVRFAAWDLSIYSQIRINRYTSPGRANPHQPEYYRPLVCIPAN